MSPSVAALNQISMKVLAPLRQMMLLGLLLLAVPASAWTTPAKASWIDWYDRPNSGYCETAPPGLPLGHYFAQDARHCPENLKRSGNVLRQKPKRTSKPKRGGDATSVDRYCFLSVRGICTCFHETQWRGRCWS